MNTTVVEFLDEAARQGSWIGGGSATALSLALAASLLEKLTHQPRARRTIRIIRQRSTRLIALDATTFQRALHARYQHRPALFQRLLKTATGLQAEVVRDAHRLLALSRQVRRGIRPKLQADLRCAEALAKAAQDGARALIATNLSWLGDRAYAAQVNRVVQS